MVQKARAGCSYLLLSCLAANAAGVSYSEQFYDAGPGTCETNSQDTQFGTPRWTGADQEVYNKNILRSNNNEIVWCGLLLAYASCSRNLHAMCEHLIRDIPRTCKWFVYTDCNLWGMHIATGLKNRCKLCQHGYRL